MKKLPDITLAVQGSDIKLTVELSKPDVPVKWLRYPDHQIFTKIIFYSNIVKPYDLDQVK